MKSILKYLSDCDIEILNWINHNRFFHSNTFFEAVSLTASFVSSGLILATLIVALKKKSRPLRVKFFILLGAFTLSALISQGLKNSIYRARPFETYPYIEKLSEGGSSSFPSGHTLEAFAMGTTFSLIFLNRRLSLLFFAWASLVAYSRMALGVHYPSDVLAGAVLGIVIGFFLVKISKKYFVAYEKAE